MELSCMQCKQSKSLSHFVRRKTKRGYAEQCKQCSRVICEICNYTFSSKRALSIHTRVIHEGIRDFACNHCDYRAGQKINLDRHSCSGKIRNQSGIYSEILKTEHYWQSTLQEYFVGRSKKCDMGICDIVNDDILIEIKRWSNWTTAIGQLLSYSIYFPNRIKMIIFFGEPPKNASNIIDVCNQIGIVACDVDSI